MVFHSQKIFLVPFCNPKIFVSLTINCQMQKSKQKIWILICLALVCCVAMAFVKPIAQNICYHAFADARSYFGIPNFWNVISNVPYFFFGGAGVLYLVKQKSNPVFKKSSIGSTVFFAGVFLISFGSAYYHAWPDNETLVWDRLPMTIAFMGFFSAMIADFINERWGKILLLPLVAIGAFSVFYWQYTERCCCGDLRLYAIVQFLPMLLIPLIVVLFKTKTENTKYLWLMMLAYLAAKFFEAGDEVIYLRTPFLSGHTLKHFAASLAPLCYLLHLKRRKQFK